MEESGGAGKQREDRTQTETQIGAPGVKMVWGSGGCAGNWWSRNGAQGGLLVERSVQFSSDAQLCPTIFDQ